MEMAVFSVFVWLRNLAPRAGAAAAFRVILLWLMLAFLLQHKRDSLGGAQRSVSL